GSQGSGDGTNLIGHGSGYALSDIFADIDPVTGGGLLADNGGLVPTVALKVSTDNPAINTADPTFVPADTLDLDGDGDTTEPIPFDARGAGFTRNFGGGVDLGAFESTGETPSLVVTTALDVIDALDGLTSLREALALANDATAGANSDGDADNDGSSVDHITFDPSLTGSTLTLTQGELVISSDVSIDGDIDDDSSPDITIDAVGTSRVLLVNSGTSLVRGMILTGGDSSNGGGMFVHRNANVHLLESTVSGNSSRTRGGGISSYGPLTITNSVIADNNTGRYGGGVYSAGALKVSGSTVSRNSSQWYGGGIDSAAGFTITNSTIEGNSAVRNGGGLSIYSSSVTAINCTITGNYSMQLHGGVFGHQFSSITMMNSIVAGNTGLLAASTAGANPDFFGKLTAGSGDNLIGYGSGYALSDIFAAIDPVTGGGLLADNGGLVPTVALKPSISNPAYNTANPTFLPSDTLDLDGDGDTTEAIPFDSRGPGFARINGGFADLGAYELSEAELNILTVQIDLASIGESGGVSNATVTRGGSMVGDLVVTLTSDDAGEASVPMTVTILDGNASASFDVTGVPDGLFDGTETVTITASAAGFDSGSDTIDVTNVDLPPDTTTPANVNLLSNGSLIIGAAGTVNNNLQITFDSNTGHYILEDIIPLNPLGGLVGNDLNPATNIIEFDPTAVGAFNNIIANLNLGNDTVTINSLRSGGPEGLDIRNDANEGDDTIHIAGPIVDAGRQLLLRSEHITLANQISTQNQAVRLEGDVTLTGNSEINAGTGAVIASGTIDGAHGLTVIAGLVQFDGDIGSTAPLTDLTASGNIVRTQNAAVTGGDVTFNANSFIPQGTISGDGNLTIRRNTAGEQNVNASDLQFITPGFASVTVGSGLTNQLLISSDGDNNLVTGSVNVGAPLTLIGQTLILGDSIQQGMGTLTLRANNTLQFTSLGSAIGTGDVMIEKLNAGGTLTVVGNFGSPTAAAPWGLNHTSVSAPGSFVDFTGGVGSGFASLTANAGSLRFNSPGAVTAQGDVSLTADDIQLNGGVFSQTGGISLTGNIDLTGNVLFKVAPGQDLIVDGGVAANGYNILVRGNGGAANQVSFLGDVVGAGSFQIDSSGASTTNQVSLNGVSANKVVVRANGIDLAGDVTSNVNVQFIGPVTLSGDVSIMSGNTSTNYTQFTGTINGPHNLTINSGAGRAILGGEIGNSDAIGDLNVVSTADNFIIRNITASGNVNWNNAGGKLTLTSSRVVSAGGNIDILADVFINLGSLTAGGTVTTP
ncbi:MAG: hypothetical protein KDA66_03550, partial [Planctomycetaceae bacterium]|nr:hypothetical protein [Planctomycetaceae bacterium]